MNITMYFVLLIGGLAAIYLLLWRQKRKRKYTLPIGPLGIPLLGNLLQIVKDPHLKFSQWALEYGSVYTIFLGDKSALVLSDIQSMKEMFSQQVATGKFKNDTMLLLSRGPYGVINTDGPLWAEQRQFCLRNLINFGFGNQRLEPLILSECQSLIEVIKEKSSKIEANSGLEINHYLKCATNNTLMTIVTGDRLSLEDQKVSEIIKEFTEYFQLTMRTGLGFFPWLKRIAPVASGYVGLDNASKRLHDFIESYFAHHSETNIPGDPRHLIDAYIDKQATTDTSSSFYGNSGKKNSIASVAEILEAGAETTTGAITWFIYYMALYPNVQRKVHEELDSVLGKCGRNPSFQDKGGLPYTEAVILETMRKSPVAPIGLIHELLDDAEFHGYCLPKGMLLIANIYHCHHDKSVWSDPDTFRPERFLETGNGREIDQRLRELVIPFQVGKRSCLGEPMAKDVIFLFVTKLLQEFEVKPAPGISEKCYFDPDLGVGLLPKTRKVVMTPRENKI